MASNFEVLMLRRRVANTNAAGQTLVNPEELVTALFVKILGDKVTMRESVCDESLLDESDDLLG